MEWKAIWSLQYYSSHAKAIFPVGYFENGIKSDPFYGGFIENNQSYDNIYDYLMWWTLFPIDNILSFIFNNRHIIDKKHKLGYLRDKENLEIQVAKKEAFILRTWILQTCLYCFFVEGFFEESMIPIFKSTCSWGIAYYDWFPENYSDLEDVNKVFFEILLEALSKIEKTPLMLQNQSLV